MISATLLLLAGALAPVTLQAVARDTAEPVIVELSLGRIVSRTVESYRLGAEALIPVGALFDLAEIRIDRATDSTLTATLHPRGERFSLDATTRTIAVGARTLRLEAADLVSDRGELYVATAPLGQVLDLEWNISWSSLTIAVVDPSRLPVAERITREWQRRTRALQTDRPIIADLARGRHRPAIDGIAVDYTALAPTGARLADGAYSTGIGLDVLGGSFTARFQSQNLPGRSRVRSDVGWYGVFTDSRWLTQVQIGDGYATGTAPRALRGIAIGNSPYIRPNQLGEIAFSGDLGPGWQVEAYRGGRLIGFDSVNALGRFSIDAPIQYGENPVDFIAYGPFGEVRRFDRNLRVDGNRLPERALEYGLAAGACRTERCSATANLDLRYGLSQRWTARAGMDQFWRGAAPVLFHPYVGLSGSPTNALSVQGEAIANAVMRAAVRYDPSTSLSVSAEASRFARDVADPILTVDGRTSQLTASAFYRPNGSHGATFVEASLDRIRTRSGTTTSGRVGGSFRRGDLQLMPAIRWQRDASAGHASSRATLSLNAFALRLPSLGPVVGQLTGRTLLEVESSLAPVTATGFVSRNLNRQLRIEVGGGWTRGQGTTALLTVAANLPTMRSYTTVSHANGRTMASQYVQGSVLYESSSRSVRLGPGPSLDRGGVTGRVFLDANGNERFDAGEMLLPRVRVSIGMQTRTSNADGEYDLWNVTPHAPALVAIDSTTLASPLWVPAYRAVEIRPGPNRYEVVDIPVMPGGVIEGIVVRAADSSGAGGMVLRLERADSETDRTIVSFRDGEFYAIGIKPGDYVLRLDPGTAERLGVRMDPIRFTMPPDVDGATVGPLVLRLY